MTGIGTLGGFNGVANAINNPGTIVGAADTARATALHFSTRHRMESSTWGRLVA